MTTTAVAADAPRTGWEIHLEGGPRDRDRISTTELLPFLIFTTADGAGQTTDHFYGPVSTDPATMTAVYQPVAGPDSAIANVWEQGMRHALTWLGLKHYGDVMAKDNPYRKAQG